MRSPGLLTPSRRAVVKCLAATATVAPVGAVAKKGFAVPAIDNVSPGVTATSYRLKSAEQAVARVLALADAASKAGTFAVGGVLVDRDGWVIAEAVNAVISDKHLSDSTAHVERQLVDWHSRAHRNGLHAPAHELTIVSSLDPCAMCAGAILRSGMHAMILASDLYAGVHTAELRPHLMPKALWGRASHEMGFFGLSSGNPAERRPRSGQAIVSELNMDVPAAFAGKSSQVFAASLDKVKNEVGDDIDPQNQYFDASPNSLRAIGRAARKHPSARPLAGPINLADERKRPLLMRILQQDGSVLVDGRGNVILGAAGREDLSVIRTSVLELIRSYVAIRRELRSELELPHQRYCSIIKRRAPTDPTKVLLELGAMGSFLEKERLAKTIPALGFLEPGGVPEIQTAVELLPKLYHDIGITAGEVK